MWKIKKLEVNELWGEKNYTIDFFLGLNIFIGSNGTGKTTILKILNSLLKIDTEYLGNLEFSSIKLLLVDEKENKRKTLRVEKNENGLSFFLSNKIVYQNFDEENSYYFSTNKTKLLKKSLRAKEKLRNELNISSVQWLPTSRISLEEELSDNDEVMKYHQYTNVTLNELSDPLDYKLKRLLKKTNFLISKIAQKIVDEDAKLRNELVKINFNVLNNFEENDFKKKEFRNTLTLLKNKKKVTKILNNLDGINSTFNLKIEKEKIIKLIDSIQKKEERYFVEDVMAVSALSFFTRYVDVFNDYISTVEKIKSPLKSLEANFKDIFEEKFKIELTNTCSFSKISNQSKHQNFNEINFSSGEKQMLIYILEYALYLNNLCIYMIDEPEISLHLKWQKVYIDLLLREEKENQFIIATHSPDIVGKYYASIINLDEIMVEYYD